MSTEASFEEPEESDSRAEQQIAMLQSQLLDVTEEKNSQIFDIQCELSAMVIQLANLQDQLLSIAGEKMLLEDNNTETETKILDFVNKDLESSAIVAKEFQLAELQCQLSNLG